MRQNFTKIVLTIFTFMVLLGTTNAQIFSEDFDGGLPADWMAVQMDGSAVTAVSNWTYTTTGPGGPFATAALASTTAANGYMIFDSDASCTMTEQDVWLISPSIDCTNFSEVVITFESYYRRFADSVSIQVSIDNMVSWTDYKPYPTVGNTEFAGQADGSQNPVPTNVIISNVAANQPDVRFAFRFLSNANTQGGANYFGCGYNWQIDDVVVTDVDPTPMFDMIVNTDFYAIPQNLSTPASQLESIGFVADIENIGQQDMTGVSLNVSVTENGGSVVHSQDQVYGTVEAGFRDIDRIFPDRYTLPATAGVVYDGSYTVTADSLDEVPIDNTVTFQFEVTDSIFRKENGTGGAVTPTTNTSGNWTVASYYYVPNGDNMVCSSIEFATNNADNSVTGANVNVFLYEWIDVNNNGEVGVDERDGTVANTGIIGNSGYQIQDGDTNVTLVLEPLNGDDPVRLRDGGQYILSLEVEPAPDGTLVPIVGNQAISYFAMEFLNDSLDMPRYTAFWNSNELGLSNALVRMNGFAPYIRMHINPAPAPDATNNQLAPENIVEVFPNPATDLVNLKLDFVSALDNVNVKITDATGKTLVTQNFDNVSQQLENFDVSKFAAGTYFVHVQTDEGNRVERFVVMK